MRPQLGRDREIAALTGLLDPGRRCAAVAVVRADPGLGATSLLARVTAAATGFRVLSATGYRDEKPFPGLALHQLLTPLGRAPSDPGRILTAALAHVARRRPLLVTVDDLHHVDDDSAHALARALTQLRDLPVVLVATTRPDAPEPEWPGHTLVLELGPLDAADTSDLLARQPARPAGRLRQEIRHAALGNPRAVVELSPLLADAAAPDPRRLAPARAADLHRRYAEDLHALPAETLRLLRFLSAGAPADGLAAALRAAGSPPAALAPAVAAGLVRRDGTFRDPLARLSVYVDTPAAERAAVHSALGAGRPAGSLAAAWHHAEPATGPDEVIAARLTAAARTAAEDRDLGFAATVALERAAELSPTAAGAATRRAAAIRVAGAHGQSAWVQQLHAVFRTHHGAHDLGDADFVRVQYELATALSRAGRQREAMDGLVEAVRRRPPTTRADGLLLATAAGLIARVSGLPEHQVNMTELVARADELPDELPDEPDGGPGDARVVPALDSALHRRAPAPACLVVAGTLRPDPPSVTSTLLLARAADEVGDTPTAVRLRLEALARLRTEGPRITAPEMWLPLLTGLVDLGRWAEATDLLAQARRNFAEADVPLLGLELRAVEAALAALRGDATRAEALAHSTWSVLNVHENRRLHSLLVRAYGLAALARDDADTAYRHFRQLFDDAGRPLLPDYGGRGLVAVAMTAVRAQQVPDAQRVLARAGEPGNPRTAIALEHARALLQDDAESGLRAAVTHPVAAVWPFDHAMARYHYGAWLRRRRRPIDARAQFRPALAAFERLGAAGFVAITRSELRAAGAEDPADHGADDRAGADLSPQQREVARLAAEGLANREIAARLLLSPRTVGTHLYNAYAKLGISTRHELRSALAG